MILIEKRFLPLQHIDDLKGSGIHLPGFFFVSLKPKQEESDRENINLINKGRKTMAYMSQEGYDQLIAELRELESVKRPEISRQIAEARDKGDLSENAEYDAAKESRSVTRKCNDK